MHKDIECILLPEQESEIKTKFVNTFKKAYKLLGEYGDKKKLHYEIRQFTNPPKSASLIRRYCGRPEQIPVNQKEFYYYLLGHQLYRQLSKHIDEYQLFINDVRDLLADLKTQIPKKDEQDRR